MKNKKAFITYASYGKSKEQLKKQLLNRKRRWLADINDGAIKTSDDYMILTSEKLVLKHME